MWLVLYFTRCPTSRGFNCSDYWQIVAVDNYCEDECEDEIALAPCSDREKERKHDRDNERQRETETVA